MNESARGYWDRHAKNYDRSMRLLGGPIPRTVQLAREAVRGARRVLELAAGTGLFTTALAREANEVVATDYAGAMVEALRARIQGAGLENVYCEQADIYDLRFPPESFDAVVAANALHLLPDLPTALAAMRRVLEPGGRLIVPTYCHDETRTSRTISRLLAITGFPGRGRFTVASHRAALEHAGLQVTRAETVEGLIPIGYLEGKFG